nr:Shedu anti-phage system protein SduA domain-containing protein [Roseivirga sp. E12]
MGLTLIDGKLSCVSLSKQDGQFKVVEATSEKIFDILRTYRSYSSSVKEKIEEFEYLINKKNVREQELHFFFEKNPDFLLFNDNYHKLRSKIVLESTEGNLIPDFVLEPYDDYYSDLVELKLPTKKIFSGTNKNRIKYSQNVAEGIAQLRTYSNYFQDSNNRNIVKSKYDIEIYKPTMYLIIGRTTDLDPAIKKDVNYELPDNYEVISYDQILNRYERKHK